MDELPEGVPGYTLDEGNTARVLDVPTWQRYRRRPNELGGPPLP